MINRRRFIVGYVIVGIVVGLGGIFCYRYGYLPVSSNERGPADFQHFPFPPDARQVRWKEVDGYSEVTFFTSESRKAILDFYTRVGGDEYPANEIGYRFDDPGSSERSGSGLLAEFRIEEQSFGATRVTVSLGTINWVADP